MLPIPRLMIVKPLCKLVYGQIFRHLAHWHLNMWCAKIIYGKQIVLSVLLPKIAKRIARILRSIWRPMVSLIFIILTAIGHRMHYPLGACLSQRWLMVRISIFLARPLHRIASFRLFFGVLQVHYSSPMYERYSSNMGLALVLFVSVWHLPNQHWTSWLVQMVIMR